MGVELKHRTTAKGIEKVSLFDPLTCESISIGADEWDEFKSRYGMDETDDGVMDALHGFMDEGVVCVLHHDHPWDWPEYVEK